MKAKYLIGGVIIAVFLVWGTSAFLKTTIRYVSIEEARSSKTTVQVMGRIDFADAHYDTDKSRLEFAIYDPEASDKPSAERMKVIYYGVIPGNFEQATSVVLKGKSRGDTFVAEQMLVKCPSKYQGKEGDQYQNVRKHAKGVRERGA